MKQFEKITENCKTFFLLSFLSRKTSFATRIEPAMINDAHSVAIRILPRSSKLNSRWKAVIITQGVTTYKTMSVTCFDEESVRIPFLPQIKPTAIKTNNTSTCCAIITKFSATQNTSQHFRILLKSSVIPDNFSTAEFDFQIQTRRLFTQFRQHKTTLYTKHHQFYSANSPTNP